MKWSARALRAAMNTISSDKMFPCRKTTFYDTETDSCARASCQKAPLFDTRESIGEKSVAHVPGFFRFLLKSGFARKAL